VYLTTGKRAKEADTIEDESGKAFHDSEGMGWEWGKIKGEFVFRTKYLRQREYPWCSGEKEWKRGGGVVLETP